nr:hypothetical protein [uncultured Campylobacter sp.]
MLNFTSSLEIYTYIKFTLNSIFDFSSLPLAMHDLYMRLRRGFVRPKFHQTL